MTGNNRNRTGIDLGQLGAPIVCLWVLLSFVSPVVAVNLTWNGGAGTWHSPNWAGGFYPDNHSFAPTVFNAYLGDNADVLIGHQNLPADVQIIVDRLEIGNSDLTISSIGGGFAVLQVARSDDAGREQSGVIDNAGTITIEQTTTASMLEVDGSVMLQGGGNVVLSGTNAWIGSGQFSGANRQLTNVDNHISGYGQFINLTRYVNESAGVITANTSGQTLSINPNNSSQSFINRGQLLAESGGVLELQGGIADSYDNTNGRIEAKDGSTVKLTDAFIIGGNLAASGTGVLEAAEFQRPSIDSVTNENTLTIRNGAWVRSAGTINNLGTIHIESTGSTSTLDFDQTVTLTGGGDVQLAGTNAWIGSSQQPGSNRQLVNHDNTIHGYGALRSNTLYVNEVGGTISANVSGETLVVDPNNVANSVMNRGLMQATNGGILELQGGVADSYDNAMGRIEAKDGSTVQLMTSAYVVGGTLATSGSGIVEVPDFQRPSIDSLTLENDLWIRNGAWVRSAGTVTNQGTIHIVSTGSGTTMDFDQTVTLAGGGEVRLEGSNAFIGGSQAPGSNRALVNQDNTIHGYGSLRNNSLYTNESDGVIDANTPGETLVIDPNNTANSFTNQGTMQASNGGVLELQGGVANSYINTGGVIQALNDSVVELITGADITGGTMDTTGTGEIRLGFNRDATLRSVELAGTTRLQEFADLTIHGGVNNSGRLLLESSADVIGAASAEFVNQAGGRVEGNGRLDLDASATGGVINHGVVAPGLSAGILDVDGDYNQSAQGTLEIEIGGTSPGTDHDQLTVSELVSLDGALSISLINGFIPSPGDVFTIIDTDANTGTTISGMFAGGTSLTVDGISLTLIYNDRSVDITNLVILCDIDGNGVCDIADMRVLYDDIASGAVGGPSDIDGSGSVDNADITAWLAEAGAFNGKDYLPGDTNLDGSVGGGDFTFLAANFGQSGLPGAYWDQGNFNGNADGSFSVGGGDFTLLAANFGHVSATAVPEPTTTPLIWLFAAVICFRFRR